MRADIELALARLAKQLEADGGGVELVAVDEATGRVTLRLLGACAACPMRHLTLKFGLEAALKEAIPQVTEVIAVS